MIHFIKKRYIIFPLGKIAMYAFNLLPFIYFYERHNCKLTVLIPSHKFFSNRSKYGVVNKSLLDIIKRSFDEKNIKYIVIAIVIIRDNILITYVIGASSKLGL